MPKVNERKENGSTKYFFMCPGCGFRHKINDRWSFNGDFEKPTFKPSVLMQTGHYASGHKGDCWCDWEKKNPDKKAPFECRVCHSFVTDGKIRFLDDSTHDLAGQTVELPDIEEHETRNP